MKIQMTNEAKTGAVVLVCVVALGVLLLKVGNFTLLQKGFTVLSRFEYTAGVKPHAPVRLSGVDVGEVKAINIIYGDTTEIELVLWLQNGVKLRRDSKAYVTTLGLMGEKYIEIKAGTSTAGYANEGDLIEGVDPMRLEDLFEKGTKVADDISQMAKDISKLTNNINATVDDNKPRIGRIFENLEETSSNFKEFSEDIKWHPWKILAKGKEKSKDEMARERAKRLAEASGATPAEAEAAAAARTPAASKGFAR